MPRNEFLHVTGQKYDSMRTRFKAQYDDENKLTRPGREIPFSKDAFRDWIKGEMQGGLRCAYCRDCLSLEEIEADHIVPVRKRGGSLALENLCIACHDCNTAKGDLTGEEFSALIKGLKTFPDFARKYIMSKLRYRPIFRPDHRPKAERGGPRISPVSTYRPPMGAVAGNARLRASNPDDF